METFKQVQEVASYVETLGGFMIQPATLLKAVFSIPFLKSQHAVAENVSKGYTCLR